MMIGANSLVAFSGFLATTSHPDPPAEPQSLTLRLQGWGPKPQDIDDVRDHQHMLISFILALILSLVYEDRYSQQ